MKNLKQKLEMLPSQ